MLERTGRKFKTHIAHPENIRFSFAPDSHAFPRSGEVVHRVGIRGGTYKQGCG